REHVACWCWGSSRAGVGSASRRRRGRWLPWRGSLFFNAPSVGLPVFSCAPAHEGAPSVGGLAAPGGSPLPPLRHGCKCYRLYDRPEDRLKQMLWRARRRYYREFWALSPVSLTVARGEALGVIGRNGSGKSTLLQLIAGTLRPTAGRVQVKGRLFALLELGAGFNPEFTGRENAALSGAILGGPRAEMQERFPAIVDFAALAAVI